ncbi:histidine kinase, partial [Streptomyces sp. 150FB]
MLLGGQAWLRWLHLVLGGALLMPYLLLGSVFIGPTADGRGGFLESPAQQFAAYAVAVPLAAASAFFPLARPLSVAAARALCGIPEGRLAAGDGRTWAARVRTSCWYALHVGLGGIISGMTLAVPPFAVGLALSPFFAALREPRLGLPVFFRAGWGIALAPFAGLLMLLALAACAAVTGALLARLAPVLLGP